jgi:hypothetical protein
MFRFSVTLGAALATIAAIVISISPASAATGAAYDACMAKCKASGLTGKCPVYCDRRH